MFGNTLTISFFTEFIKESVSSWLLSCSAASGKLILQVGKLYIALDWFHHVLVFLCILVVVLFFILLSNSQNLQIGSVLGLSVGL